MSLSRLVLEPHSQPGARAPGRKHLWEPQYYYHFEAVLLTCSPDPLPLLPKHKGQASCRASSKHVCVCVCMCSWKVSEAPDFNAKLPPQHLPPSVIISIFT